MKRATDWQRATVHPLLATLLLGIVLGGSWGAAIAAGRCLFGLLGCA